MREPKALVKDMTLEEKASLCSGLDFWHLKGIDRLGIPSIMVTDGPHGLRKQIGDPAQAELSDTVPSTCFPTASALAATWNRELVYKVGRALAEECKEEKVGVILGPGANIKRSPLCGRNFEYFSEDPFLSGEMAKSHINGVQSLGIGTSLKHFAVNNQEHRRMTIDAVVDERALREIYLAGYEIAVTGAQPWTVMCAYNRVNGIYACEHPELLRRILKEEWGHRGLVLSDWGATNERVDALAAGMEVEMPGPNPENDASIAAAVAEGRLDEFLLDQAVEHILQLIYEVEKTLAEDFTYDRTAHHALARKAAGEGAVLLKNQEGALPLEESARVALVGEMARQPRFQGAGSSLVNPSQLDNIHDELVKIAGDRISFAPGYDMKSLDPNENLIAEALETSRNTDVVVVCAGLPDTFEVEGLDRQHLRLPESHNRLIEALAGVHSRVVVVLSNGSPVEMPWIDQVQAVLEGYLGGQAGAGAIADILYGELNPSGKLAETFPLKLEDTPCIGFFPGGPGTVEYRESIYVGYRFYDQVNKPVLFPFGHGLSYTTFEYSDLELDQPRMSAGGSLTVSLKLRNTGSRKGKEIVQLYVSPLAPGVFRPPKELKGFAKLDLEPGEEQKVTLELDSRAFACYSTGQKDWVVEPGLYRILVGASSRDIRCQAEVQVDSIGTDYIPAERDRLPAYLDFPPDGGIRREDFEGLLGRPLPENRMDRKGSYTLNTPLGDLKGTLFASWLKGYLRKRILRAVGDEPGSATSGSVSAIALLMGSIARGMPLRGVMTMGGGGINRTIMDGILTMLNGRFFRGLFAVLRASRAKTRNPD
jgi:beta-glucosidase